MTTPTAPIATAATATTATRPTTAAERRDETIEGVVELLGNGSGFVRVSPPEPSDDDVYISAAQVRRCELVSGDRVSGPVRKPRRSERYPSLVRVDTINGAPADEVAEGTPFDELPCALPVRAPGARLRRPDAEGHRVADADRPRLARGHHRRRARGQDRDAAPPRRRAGRASRGSSSASCSTGVRPEEAAEWKAGPVAPAAVAHAAPPAPTRRARPLERAVETAQRIAARGGHAVVLVDTLDGIAPGVARRALAAARAIVDGGSLTVIATASSAAGRRDDGHRPRRHAAPRRATSPRSTCGASGTLRPELLVGDAGADAIAAARAEAD